ncbi:MAG: hypothetical protein HQ530_05435 [Parcubacteria group bacterium]|nr:hypothetical protein [Parcubacteria group bacterium]
MTETQTKQPTSKPIVKPKKSGKIILVVLIVAMGMFFSAVLAVGGWYFWGQLESEKNSRSALESSFNELKEEINQLKSQIDILKTAEDIRKEKEAAAVAKKAKKQKEEDAKKESEETTESDTEESTTDNDSAESQCEFNKDVSLQETTTYGIFGEDTFDTVVCGYLETKEEEVWDEKQTNAYFAIKSFYHDGFKQSIEKGISEGNSINNKKSDGTYLFNLGCYQDSKVSGRDYETGVYYIDDAAQSALQNSSADKPVSIVLSFGLHGGSGCSCCNLAHKVRAY